jgi:glycosyltransferase involved in cell wall biosynthesis
MKVLHVMPYPGVGGTEIATRRIADAARSFGVHSTALLLQPTVDQIEYFEAAGIACLKAAPRPEPSLLREAPRFFRESWRIARICADFDLVHCADAAAAYHVAAAGKLARRPVLCHVRNREIRLPPRDRVFVGAADHFVFVSRSTHDQFPIKLPARRWSVLYDGVESPLREGLDDPDLAYTIRAELGLPGDAVLAAMFARVNPQKDYDTLIAAAVRLRTSHPRLHFLIVGDNALVPQNKTHFEYVRSLAAAAGVLDRFVFTGHRDDAARLMLAADVCVLCTHFEGLPLVLIEAMAAGRPCVATAVDGIPEALTDEVTGLLHTHQDARGLATAIARLIDDPILAARLGAAAQIDADRRFGKPRFARDVYALYGRLVTPKTLGARLRSKN